ncbi:MerR family transcriptional regulator [Salicibibacter cibi]|uniref:MerR family transcriptional regulator n=1 Tax=Salicibibacter cibi TaxID=2743001 RepID=A0A7T6ZCU9_9BACI|nr:MerR family transcriptional regulator [Salicibibacter cibi]QQK81165.1 MerR family transcriptional regulator [Salicibibacter cibi]
MNYKTKKLITIGIVCEMTGLSERQIRYYEERKLIFPERTKGGTRKYSFNDIESLMDIAEKMDDGMQTFEIKQLHNKNKASAREEMIKGQINARFGQNRAPLDQSDKRL